MSILCEDPGRRSLRALRTSNGPWGSSSDDVSCKKRDELKQPMIGSSI